MSSGAPKAKHNLFLRSLGSAVTTSFNPKLAAKRERQIEAEGKRRLEEEAREEAGGALETITEEQMAEKEKLEAQKQSISEQFRTRLKRRQAGFGFRSLLSPLS